MCSGTSLRVKSGVLALSARAVRSSANSIRTDASVMIPVSAIHCSTCPRMSAAFHADRFAPSRDTTSSTAASRSKTADPRRRQ